LPHAPPPGWACHNSAPRTCTATSPGPRFPTRAHAPLQELTAHLHGYSRRPEKHRTESLEWVFGGHQCSHLCMGSMLLATRTTLKPTWASLSCGHLAQALGPCHHPLQMCVVPVAQSCYHKVRASGGPGVGVKLIPLLPRAMPASWLWPGAISR
jgi:hypothetical protein